MPQQRGSGLSLAEWLVLCLVSERPTHGFAIAGLLAEDGSLGRVWHVQKIVVYRAARRLEQLGLIMASDKQPSALGPARVLLWATPEGRQAAEGWLRQLAPVASSLAGQIHTTTGFDRVLAIWRHESVLAALRFLDGLLAMQPAGLAG